MLKLIIELHVLIAHLGASAIQNSITFGRHLVNGSLTLCVISSELQPEINIIGSRLV